MAAAVAQQCRRHVAVVARKAAGRKRGVQKSRKPRWEGVELRKELQCGRQNPGRQVVAISAAVRVQVQRVWQAGRKV